MKKKVLLVLLVLAMVLSTVSLAACNKTTSSAAESSTPASSVEVSSEEVSSTPDSTPVSEVSSVETSSAASVETSSAASAVTSSKTSTATSSKTSTATSSKVTSTSTGTSTIGSNPDYKLPSTITIYQEAFMGDSGEHLDQKKLWMDTLSARYGVNITVFCITKGQTSEIYDTRLASKELTGMVYNYGWSYMYSWYNSDAVYALDEYLAKNATWKLLPEAARNQFKIKGQIWAVPNGWNAGMTGNTTQWLQSIRADWMATLGLGEVGYTMDINTFKDVITAFGNNKDKLMGANTIPVMFGGDWYALLNIFEAFGVFMLDANSSAGYSYNPTTGCFEDGLLRDGALQAIELLRYFYSNTLTIKSTFDLGFSDQRNLCATTRVGSFCNYFGRYSYTGGFTVNALAVAKYGTSDRTKMSSDGYSAMVALQEATWYDTMLVGTQTTKLQGYSVGAGGYCLMKGTNQPGETVNFFIDLMFATEDNIIEGIWNLMNVVIVKQADGTYIRKYYDESALTDKWYSSANLVTWINPDLYPSTKYMVNNEGTDVAATNAYNKIVNAYKSAQSSSGINSGRVVNLPEIYKTIQYYSATYTKYIGEIQNFQQAFVYDGAMKTNITIDKLFETYKKNMASVGGDKVLQEGNAAFNFTNDYQSYTK